MGLWFSKIDRPEELSAHALRAAVIERVMTDPEFLGALSEDAEYAVASRFRSQPYKIRFVVEQPDELSILLPCWTEQLARTVDAIAAKLADALLTKGQLDAVIVQKAWNDSAFLARLRDHPRDALEAVLKDYAAGLNVPPDKTVRLYEEQPGECVIIISSIIKARVNSSRANSVEKGAGDGTIVLPCRSLTVLRSHSGDGQSSTTKEGKP
jgi:hypothetical protein